MNLYSAQITAYRTLYQVHNYVSKAKVGHAPIIISGTTRGGTTWLMEMLYEKQMQIVWEPTKYETLACRTGNDFVQSLGTIPYIPENAVWEEAYVYFDKLLNGKIKEEINSDSHPLLLSNPFAKNRLLLKFCNINLLLPWLCRNFNIHPILLVRNPMAVIASQLQHKGFKYSGTKYNLFELNKPKYQDVFLQYEKQISAIDSQVSMFANWWAIQHVELLQHPKRASLWTLVYYEDLVTSPRSEIGNLLKQYNIEKKSEENNYQLPSATSQEKSIATSDYLNKWKKQLEVNQIIQIERVLQSYGLEQFIIA